MGKKGSIKHAFLGGNTTSGFYSYYYNIISQKEARKLICIKGGPGTGKSTFMKQIGQEMLDRGYDLEFMHCSSDNNSLDAIIIPKIKVALVDATAPHIVDPRNPGAVDEILNLGEYWNEDGIRKHKDKIIQTNTMIGKTFARSYRYLAASKDIYDDIVQIHKESMNPAGINIEADKIIADIFGDMPINNKIGNVRKLFGSAITPNGLVNYLDSIINIYEDIYVIKGEPGTGTEILISKIADEAVQRGLDVESYYCPIEPQTRIEHIVIPALNLAFTTSNKYHEEEDDIGIVVDLNAYLDHEVLDKYEEILAYDIETFDMLLTKAIDTTSEAKRLHDILEEYYIPNMRFDEVQLCWGRTLQKILKYAEEFE